MYPESEGSQHHQSQQDAIPAKQLKVMLLNITQQKAQHKNRYDKGHRTPRQEGAQFHGSKVETKLYQLQQAGTEHHGHGQEKSVLRRHGAGHTDEQRPHDGGAGAGSSREYRRDHLEHADEQRRLIGDLRQGVDPGTSALIPVFNKDEGHAENNQCQRHHLIAIKQGVQHIVKQHAYDCRRHTGNQDFKPHGHDIHAQPGNIAGILFPGPGSKSKGPEFIPEEHHHCQDGSQLNHHVKHAEKVLAHTDKGHQFLQQDQMPGAADRQPFRNTLHDSVKYCFQYLQHYLCSFLIIVPHISYRHTFPVIPARPLQRFSIRPAQICAAPPGISALSPCRCSRPSENNPALRRCPRAPVPDRISGLSGRMPWRPPPALWGRYKRSRPALPP